MGRRGAAKKETKEHTLARVAMLLMDDVIMQVAFWVFVDMMLLVVFS